jgi:uncharacterized SAM-binding protein YcdF (DUF218 family)
MKTLLRHLTKLLRKCFRNLLLWFGGLFLGLLLLSFTDIPFNAYFWLGTHQTKLKHAPDYIVVMGAGGMPGPEGLIRCYYAAQAAKQFPESKIIIALPTLRKWLPQSHTMAMYREMVLRGVDSTRFLFEINGTNTRQQAINCLSLCSNPNQSSVLIITSPDHMYRSVATFRKAGFAAVGGSSSFESGFDPELLTTEDERNQRILEPSRNIDLRYNMWNYLKLEITVIREAFAITYYYLKGWI